MLFSRLSSEYWWNRTREADFTEQLNVLLNTAFRTACSLISVLCVRACRINWACFATEWVCVLSSCCDETPWGIHLFWSLLLKLCSGERLGGRGGRWRTTSLTSFSQWSLMISSREVLDMRVLRVIDRVCVHVSLIWSDQCFFQLLQQIRPWRHSDKVPL